jgi:hypothetical protein
VPEAPADEDDAQRWGARIAAGIGVDVELLVELHVEPGLPGASGRTSEFAIPTYVFDTPYGKAPLSYPYLRGHDGDHVVVEARDGRVWRELNPA